MKVEGLAWLGIRTTDRYPETVSFFKDALGLEIVEESADFANFRLPTGDAVEIFGPSDRDHAFFEAPVVGFKVEDVHAARSELEDKGVEFIGPVHTSGGMSWSHFRGPDGNVYELTATG